ncbi:hypothetical protein ASH01_11450 [Terrabacter sp. Soil811]|uniref:hypothetical protein n=1 Tax=Terrabacter sp. Soil811 TaxID=1736419 RepID=UPI0006FAE954|nr:hypothetical protein [Terrabacter sp. Soil811]KRF44600.1 hypothetical protein ASH01_11450 [Terrabacter sp. Soil811]
MHLLYVVDFDAEPASQDVSAFDLLAGHVAAWLSRGSTVSVNEADLTVSGSVVLPPAELASPADVERTAAWEVLAAPDDRALRVSVQHPLASGVELTTRVTVSEVCGRTAFRVGMSREFSGGALTPVRDTSVFQPGVVRAAAMDEQLVLRIGGQRIDERFAMVRSAEEACELVAALRDPARLPVLLVHLRTLAGRDAAFVASRKLIGLVRVVTLNYTTREAVEAAIPGLLVPFGGAQLVWSDLGASGISVSSVQIQKAGREVLRDALMPRLAPVSALARGTDEGWRQARRAAQRAARMDADARLRLAQEAADVGAQSEALEEKVRLLEAELADTQALAEAYSAEADDLRALARSAEDLRAQVEYWRGQYLAQYAPEGDADVDPWEQIPDLVAATDPTDTFLALTDASESRIVFTEAAERSWKRISYPHPDDMTAALTALARAAHKLYSEDAGPMGHVDEWFKTGFGLNISTADDTIEKNKAMRYFDFADKRRDQTPHVKVRDAVKPNEVGRIHFAFDKDGCRLIVNHVALKLYGL